METAIRARQAYRRLVVVDLDGDAAPLESPDLSGLPEWAQRACAEETLFVTHHDDYAALWVETPFVVEGMPIYVRLAMDTILMRRGEGYVAALGPCRWKYIA